MKNIIKKLFKNDEDIELFNRLDQDLDDGITKIDKNGVISKDINNEKYKERIKEIRRYF